jgi:hypothetical protein
MARRRKSIVSSQGSKDNEQQLFKVEWTQNRWGGHVGKQKKFEAGDLLRPAMLDEVVPEREDYFIRPMAEGNCYYLLHKGFSKLAEYEDIKTFVKYKYVYVYKDFNLYGVQK